MSTHPVYDVILLIQVLVHGHYIVDRPVTEGGGEPRYTHNIIKVVIRSELLW